MYATIIEHNVAQDLVTASEAKLKQKYDDINCQRQQMPKNNGIVKDAFIPRRSENQVAPTIYLEPYVAGIINGELTLDEASELIVDAYETHANGMKVPVIDHETAKTSLYVVAVNRSANAEMLRDVPHRDVAGDVTLVMRYNCGNDGDARASFLVNDGVLGQIQMTSNEAFDVAVKNTINDGFKIDSMDVLLRRMGMPEEMLEGMNLPMKVVTNEAGIDGAVGVFIDEQLREQIHDELGSDFYVLPSSRHEVICVPDYMGDPESLQEMICSVNANEVAAEDVLASEPFFVGKNLKIESCVEQLDDVAEQMDAITEQLPRAAHI